jgi:hypothetical protein
MMQLLTACSSPTTADSGQPEMDRFVKLISSDGKWGSGRVTTVTTNPDASDEELIAAAAEQLNQNPAPLKEWRVLKKEQISHGPFKYLLAVIDSDQGHKIVVIAENLYFHGNRWARMYNCDAVFSSPQ